MTIIEHIRMIWAVASKDLVDAWKNKTILAVGLGVLMLMLSSIAMGWISNLDQRPKAVYLDEGKSALARAITRNREIVFSPVEDHADLLASVGNAAEPVLGLVLPADFDQQVEGKGPLSLQAYIPYWIGADEAGVLVDYYESELSQRTGVQLDIQTAVNLAYPLESTWGYPAMIAMGLVAGVLTIGLMMVPLLLIEEKETHTIDALLVSPAGLPHLLLGKSLAGLSYSLAAALVILAFTFRWIVHWEQVIVATLLGGLLAVAVGLLLGSLFEQVTSVNMAAGLVIMLLIFPVFLWPSLASKLSPAAASWAHLWPSLAVNDLVMASMGQQVAWGQLWLQLVVLVVSIAAILLLAGWRVRRLDR
ncbi:MAG: ABC transporter permease [Anaerolineales bacterium]|nr:ABC transporter permease [Anaerolineales bacterium]